MQKDVEVTGYVIAVAFAGSAHPIASAAWAVVVADAHAVGRTEIEAVATSWAQSFSRLAVTRVHPFALHLTAHVGTHVITCHVACCASRVLIPAVSPFQ